MRLDEGEGGTSPPGRAAADSVGESAGESYIGGTDEQTDDTPRGFPIAEHQPPAWISSVVTVKQLEELTPRSLWARLVCQSSLAPSRRHMALTVLQSVNKKAATWPSLKTLAANTGMNEKTVRRCIDDLAEGGWLRVDRPSRRRSRHLTLCWPRSGRGVRSQSGPDAHTDEPSADSVSPSADSVSPECGPDAHTVGTPVGNPEGGFSSSAISLEEVFVSKLRPNDKVNPVELASKVAALEALYGEEKAIMRLRGIKGPYDWPSQVINAAKRWKPDPADKACTHARNLARWVNEGRYQVADALEDIKDADYADRLHDVAVSEFWAHVKDAA